MILLNHGRREIAGENAMDSNPGASQAVFDDHGQTFALFSGPFLGKVVSDRPLGWADMSLTSATQSPR